MLCSYVIPYPSKQMTSEVGVFQYNCYFDSQNQSVHGPCETTDGCQPV